MRAPGCATLIALLRRTPNRFMDELTQRVVHSIGQPWGVQLAAGFSREKAMAMYARAFRRYESVLKDRDPGIQSSGGRGRAIFYQVRIGADTRQAANELCRVCARSAARVWCCGTEGELAGSSQRMTW